MFRKVTLIIILLLLVSAGLNTVAFAQDKLQITTGVDFYNRYVWRGLDIANTPSLQPTLAVGYSGLEFGIWGAYTLSNKASASDEIDFWLSYTLELENTMSISVVATDYYFPNAGVDFFNFNDYDAVDDSGFADPGAHTIELGLSITGPETFPVTVSGYVNVHNEEGNNTYFQVDYPVALSETGLTFFAGVTAGSEDNPYYYNAQNFQWINVGVQASREIKVSESLSMPLNVAFVLNPNEEISHLLVGLSF